MAQIEIEAIPLQFDPSQSSESLQKADLGLTDGLPDGLSRGLSLALGNFDGVHLGHQAVLAQAAQLGDWGVVTFAPHPRRFLHPDMERFELMNEATFRRVLAELGAHKLLQIRFDQALCDLKADEFLDALNRELSPKAITTGDDFRFGHNREGDVAFLRAWGAKNGVHIETAPKVELDGEKVSSTRIREALRAGQPKEAARLLGRPHIINQKVTKGDQRGRDLGFPTANLYPKSVMLPKFGVYATKLRIHDGAYAGDYQGASSLGVRPTFGVNQPNFETYILDFDGDIYGAEISVELIEYLRGEEKFDDIDALIVQMNKDVEKCREIFAS